MKIHGKQILALASGLALIASFAAGCKPKDPNVSGSSEGSSQEQSYDFKGRTFKIGAWWDIAPVEGRSVQEDKYIERIKQVEEDYNCKVEFVTVTDTDKTYVSTTLAGDPVVDIAVALSYNILPGYIQGGIAYPLSDLKAFNFDDYKWNQSVRNFSTFDGKVYAMDLKSPDPRFGVFYNKTLFEEYGYPDLQELYGKGEWDWNKFLEVAKSIKWDTNGDNEVDIYPVSGEYFLWNFIYSNGGNVVDRTSKAAVAQNFDDPKVIEAMEFGAKFQSEVKMFPGDGDTQFRDGTVAMAVLEWWRSGNYYTKDGTRQMFDNYSWVPFPKGPSADKYYSYGKEISPFFMLKTTKNPEDVAVVFNAITNYAESDSDWDEWLEVKAEIQADDSATVKNVVDMVNSGNIVVNPLQGFTDLFNLVNEMFDKVSNSELTPQVALEQYDSAIKKAVEDANNKDWASDFENQYTDKPIDPNTQYEELAATGKMYYADFVWGEWYFNFNEDKARELAGGKAQTGGADSALTTGEVYTHGDLFLVGLDETTEIQKIVIKTASKGQMPYKVKLEYTENELANPPTDIPAGTVTVKEYTDYYDANSDTLTIELAEPISARTFWLQALTDGEGDEPGETPWSIAELHLYKAK